MKETLKLVRIADTTEGYTKKGEPWRKTNAVFETTDQYPKTIVIGAFNSQIEALMAIPVGSTCDVTFEISSREWNGKFFTDCKMNKIELMVQQAAQPQPQPQPQQQKPKPQPQQAEMDWNGSNNDDLPF